MNKLMITMAAVATMALTASAESWFTDAVTAYPEGWSNTSGATKESAYIDVDADAESPLTYAASSRNLTDYSDVAVDTSILFYPFTELPELTGDEKCGVCVMGEKFYVIQKSGEENAWVDSGVAWEDNDTADHIVVTFTKDGDAKKVTYKINDTTVAAADITFATEAIQNICVSGTGKLYSLSGTATSAIVNVDVTFSYDKTAGVLGVKYGEIAVEPGAVVSMQQGSVITVTAAQNIPQNPTPADLGITAGAFASATAAEVTQVFNWATKQGVTLSTVNAMNFANPGANEQAYAFNVSPADASAIATEKAKLDIANISFDGDEVVITISGDTTAWNIQPVVQGKAEITDEWEHAKTTGDHFFRTIITK